MTEIEQIVQEKQELARAKAELEVLVVALTVYYSDTKVILSQEDIEMATMYDVEVKGTDDGGVTLKVIARGRN